MLPQDVLDQARALAGKTTGAYKLPGSLRGVLPGLIAEALTREDNPGLLPQTGTAGTTGRGRRPTADRPPRRAVVRRLSVGSIVTAVRIDVASNQIEPALKALKKHMLKEGIFQEMKRRAFYEKPSVKRKRKQAQARKRRRKAMKRADSAGDWDR